MGILFAFAAFLGRSDNVETARLKKVNSLLRAALTSATDQEASVGFQESETVYFYMPQGCYDVHDSGFKTRAGLICRPGDIAVGTNNCCPNDQMIWGRELHLTTAPLCSYHDNCEGCVAVANANPCQWNTLWATCRRDIAYGADPLMADCATPEWAAP